MQKLRSGSYRAFIVLLVMSALWLLALPLTAGAQDESIFASVRVYEGVDPMDMAEISRRVEARFLPIISANDGFIAYYLLPAGDTLVAMNLFATEEQSNASNAAAAYFVAERLAPLLPNAPRIVEGAVDIGVINVMDKDWSDLYASVRVYDGMNSSDMDSFVTIVKEGFVPLMIDSDGFYAYMLLDDGAGGLAAISMFESEASALASNEQARDFVAENLTSYLPNDPDINSGSLSVAALDIDNFAKYALGMKAFVSIRQYDGLDPDAVAELMSRTAEGFVPIINQVDGFIGYFLMSQDTQLAAITVFDTAENASASNAAAADFVAENFAHLLPNAPVISEGVVDIWQMPSEDDAMADGMMELHGGLRVYQNVVVESIDTISDDIKEIFLTMQQEAEGYFGYMMMYNREGVLGALSLFDSAESAAAIADDAAAFVAEYVAEYLPDPPTSMNGAVGVAALAGYRGGANFIGDEMMAEAGG